jgi:hypothetical protein
MGRRVDSCRKTPFTAAPKIMGQRDDMCKNWISREPCMDFKCHHNVFWEGLNLGAGKINLTRKAREIRNCCCLIDKPWTPGEIGEIWGVRTNWIRQCEKMAWSKVMNRKRHIKSALGEV